MTHTSDPVPYLLYDSAGAFPPARPADGYSEEAVGASKIRISPGCDLFARMLNGK
jgi:2,3-bisphosphoglycerate-independent phosphoglycerate mutase